MNFLLTMCLFSVSIPAVQAMDSPVAEVETSTVPTKFNRKDPLNPENRLKALKLYRGAYRVLSSEPISLEVKIDLARNKQSRLEEFSKNDYNPIHVFSEPLSVIEINEVQWRIAKQDEQRSKLNKLKLDEIFYPELNKISYRSVESIKTAAQALYNAFEPLMHVYYKDKDEFNAAQGACDISHEVRHKADVAIGIKMNELGNILSQFSEDTLKKIIDKSDHDVFLEWEKEPCTHGGNL